MSGFFADHREQREGTGKRILERTKKARLEVLRTLKSSNRRPFLGHTKNNPLKKMEWQGQDPENSYFNAQKKMIGESVRTLRRYSSGLGTMTLPR